MHRLVNIETICCVTLNLFFTDVNECLSSDHGCEQSCTNTIGSYLCNCTVGYTLNADGRSCNGMFRVYLPNLSDLIITLFSDVDECLLSTDECEQTCENTVGSYVCSCGEGYELNLDGHKCTGIYVSLVIP